MFLDDIVIIVCFLLNILICGYGIWSDKKPYSLNKIFWIFSFIFLALIPFAQYYSGLFAWGKTFSPDTILKANGIILSCVISYTIAREFFIKRIQGKPFVILYTETETLHIHKSRLIYFAVIYFAAAIVLIILSGKGLLLRSANASEMLIKNSTLQLLTDKTLKGIMLYGLLLSIVLLKTKQIRLSGFLLILAVAILANFPIAVPRYWAATFYLAILITFWGRRLIKPAQLFSSVIIAGILLVYPILSIFRYNKATILSKFHSIKSVFQFSFSGGDFDAYTSLCCTIEYVHQQGITFGKQLATVLLFFIPRAVWEGKSIGSGALVNKIPGSDFSNFCSPFIAEGYINFGFSGSICFIIFLAWLVMRYDNLYWQSTQKTYNFMFYPAAIGLLFFVLRGDLLSSFAYTAGIYISGYCCHRFLVKKA